MKLIVGLGNPGREYAKTRHNAGFRVLDLLAKRLGVGFERSKFKGDYASAVLAHDGKTEEARAEELWLVKPLTFMNLSGETVAGFCGYFKVGLADLLVVVDDVALALGRVRLRAGGSDGGHNGLRDISLRLGSQAYARLRVGIGGREAGADHQPDDLVDHVLSRFSAQEEELLEPRLEAAADACLCWAREGIEAAMSRYNAGVQGGPVNRGTRAE